MYISVKSIVQGLGSVTLPDAGGPPIQVLGAPLDGFQCKQPACSYLTRNKGQIRLHCNSHGLAFKTGSDALYQKVKMQSFFPASGRQRYFVVCVPDVADSGADARAHKEEVEDILAEYARTQEERKRQEQVMDAEVAKTDKTGWWKFTEWPEHFANRNCVHLAHAIRLPRRDEPKLQKAARAVEQLVEQSVRGLSSLPRETRRWVKSAQANEIHQQPIARLQNPESQARYAGYIVMFVCYVLRIVAAEEADKESEDTESSEGSSTDDSSDGDGSSSDCSDESPPEAHTGRRVKVDPMKDAREMFPWKEDQKLLATMLWEALDSNDEAGHIVLVRRMLSTFIMTTYIRSPFESGLVHFAAVLGFDSETRRLRTAKNYSYLVAGMVYCVRVISVEHLLPPAQREQQGLVERDHYLDLRKRFLADGSFSPTSQLLSLLAYGKFIGMNTGNAGNAFWSEDKKIFCLNGRPIVIHHFQLMAQELLTELEDLLWGELLWVRSPGQRFPIRLDLIQDDVACTRRGMSFVTHGNNGLENGLRWMLERMMQDEQGRKLRSGDGTWNVARVKLYLRSVKRFKELELANLHIDEGMPGRGTEITSMRFRNGALQDRNLFVMDGQIMTVVRYYKSQSQFDKPKVIPRFLPSRLSQVLVVYLAYVQPFEEYLTVEVLGGSFTDYLWANEQGPWHTDHLTRVLKRETGKHLGVALNTLDYRHTAVGIGREVVGDVFGRGYQDEVGEIEEPEVDEDGESPLELQSARTTKIGLANYSVPIDIVKHLSMRSIETFRPLSRRWHEFLGVDGHEVRPSAARKRRWEEEGDGQDKGRDDLAVVVPQKKTKPGGVTASAMSRAMQQALGQATASFKSDEQEQAMFAMVNGQTPLVVVLPTGGGKSLLFMVPACLDHAGVTVVVVPFRALIEDLATRIRARGIDCVEWVNHETNPASVMLVGADVAGGAGFLKYASSLKDKKQLQRVVIDECHLIITSSHWRPKLAKLRNLRVLACPIVLLTATLPPVLEGVLGRSMLIQAATYIRASTVRPNIRYYVSWCGRGKAMEAALAMCRRRQEQLRGGQKGVIYCHSRTACEMLAGALGCKHYHAGELDRTEILASWLDEGGLIVATSALGTGVNFPSIVFVLHVGMPWSMIDYCQESGRAGRSGEVADSVIIVEPGEVERRIREGGASVDVCAMGMFIESEGCRRGKMSEYMDGQRVVCSDMDSAGCDRCGEGRIEWQQAQSLAASEWQEVEASMDELRAGCAICWVLGRAGWQEHRTMLCTAQPMMMGRDMDEFRRGVRDAGNCHSCRRCWVSQKWCATGQDVANSCQWPNIVIPVARAATGIADGLEIIRQCGFQGECEVSCQAYQNSQQQQQLAGENLAQANIQKYIHFVKEYGVLCCSEHKAGIENLDVHLRQKHSVPVNERRKFIESCALLRRQGLGSVTLPDAGGPPIQVLGAPLDGFQCKQPACSYLTRNKGQIRLHCNSHGLAFKTGSDALYQKVKMQSFFPASGRQRYFVVCVPDVADSGADARAHKEEVEDILAEYARTQEERKRQEQVMDAEVAKTDKTGWWKFTEWPEHFANRNCVHLAHAIRLPRRDEPKLQKAARAVEQLVEQSVRGLSSLPRETRRWVKSAQANEIHQQPIARLQNPESQARYAGYIVMFVCYVLRIVAAEEADKESEDTESSEGSSTDDSSDGDGSSSDCSDESPPEAHTGRRVKVDPMKDAREMFPWKEDQKLLATMLWEALDSNDEAGHIVLVRRMLSTFIMTTYIRSPFESGLVHFAAVLGFDSETRRLRTAKNYSYLVAGMVYCVRVISVEHLLPPAQREQQGLVERDHYLDLRKRFLADGSFSPTSQLLSLLAYGKFIGMNTGNAGNAFWSEDKKIFYLNGRPIVIHHFQLMAQELLTELEDLLWGELLWVRSPGQRFPIRLDLIQDDVACTRRGMSFVTHGNNGLENGLRWMLERMMQDEQGRKLRSGDGTWNVARVKLYLRSVKRFKELELANLHIDEGMPGRGTEITSMRFRNGALQDRNLFVMDGQIMTVVRYYKSQSQFDKPKVIPRFLPSRLSQVLVVYLAYVQPFEEYLTVEVLGGSFTDYLWANEQGPWHTDHLTRVLKRETGKHLGVALNTLDYRHTAVGIGREVVGDVFGRGYQDEVGEIEEPEVDEDGESPLELQSARTTKIGLANYSVPIDIVKHLSMRSIETFRPLSRRWHEFLGVDGHEVRPSAARKRRWEEEGDGQDKGRDDLAVVVPQKKTKPGGVTASAMSRAMQQALGQATASFKSDEQEQAMFAMVNGQTPLVVVLPTGGGKSLLFMVPACLDHAGVTVVVVPFRALIEDLATRIRARGIDCVEWVNHETNPASVMLVGADVAGGAGFLKYASSLKDKKQLQRVVIDECHLIITSSHWRPKLAKLRNLRVLACPIVLLTATLPPVLEGVLGRSMLIQAATYIRASTVRPNIRYYVSWCGRGKAMEAALAMCRRRQEQLRGGQKGVIYCHSRTACEMLAGALGCKHYHAGELDRTEILASWLDEGGLIVATSALGTGVNFPSIVFVLHVGMPWSMIDYCQESGRAGRSGEVADSVIIVEPGEVERRIREGGASVDVCAMGMFIESEGCRRGKMSEYMDGQRVVCSDMDSAGCDRCGEGRIEWQQAQSLAASEWQEVEASMDELRAGCAICWVLGRAGWQEHRTMLCTAQPMMMGRDMDEFRRGVRDAGNCHSCRRCWVSQKWCATGQDVANSCQWPNIVIPVARAATGIADGLEIIRQCGFQGECEVSCQAYQ
ncbi:hypothetical protein PMIN01_12628 [Paraphaeosphaeria minitans]|uniref:DNA 3'-5' helicase n=1 Tax=Paraphaeosphaeria minitans TaxID=565426 RepID=A0A9P6G6H9_9PLEO|nr:hypothetical protein PMIN01_12628 [Paraphaeosphaeria minitans]